MKLLEWRLSQNPTPSQAEAALKIGVSQPAYCRYENGESIPRPDIMARIPVATDGAVNVADFYDAPQTSETESVLARAGP